MLKSKIENWLDCFAEFCDDRIIDRLAPKRSAAEDADFQKASEDLDKCLFDDVNKALGLPPLDAKNPYRFW